MEVQQPRIKEVTFIQMGGRGGDAEIQNRQSHTRVVDKNQEGYLRSKGYQPHTRLPSQGFQCQEDKSL